MNKNRIIFKPHLFFLAFFWLTALAWGHSDVTTTQAKAMINANNDLIVIDVREPGEYCGVNGHIPGARNYPWNSGVLQARYTELPSSADILVVCGSGIRSNYAANFLDSQGYLHIYDMLGGMSAWTYDRIGCIDTDGDAINDDLDNCPAVNNSDQTDSDADGWGNACDNCPIMHNPSQDNADSDARGDLCDNCPGVANADQADSDCDGLGNSCDGTLDCTKDVNCDDDCDGFFNQEDNCPAVANGFVLGTCERGYVGQPCLDNSECGINGVCNMNQEDTLPPSGNVLGDVCDCEGNFDCDTDVDGTDASTFKADFGRGSLNRPCTAIDACNGDFTCNGNVDGTDAAKFKSDFGRNTFKNPCPQCTLGETWCVYP